MEENYFADRKFGAVTQQELIRATYEGCTFHNCEFTVMDLSRYQFIDCVFNDCNLSMVKLSQTILRDVCFRGCKMLGLHFEQCSHFGCSFSFEKVLLDQSSFYKMKIPKTLFKECKLNGVDFTEADLNGAVFDNCDLLNAVFDHTQLGSADFRTAFNFTIDPDINKLKKAKFSVHGLAGLLSKYDLHISG